MPIPVAIDQLPLLFETVSDAVQKAQHSIDARSAEGPYAWYTIPQVSIAARFALTQASGGLINLLFGSDDSEQLSHTLQFSLLADVPSQEQPLPAPADPAALSVMEPPWLVALADRPRLAQMVLDALTGKASIAFDIPDSPGTADLQDEARTFVNTLGSTKDESVVFLRIAAAPEEYLVVRIGDGGYIGGHDGVFLLQPHNATAVTVYSFLGSGQQWIWYEPFRRISTTFMDWFANGLPGVPAAPDTIPGSFGNIEFSVFAQGLLQSVQQAAPTAAAAPFVPGAPATTYVLRDVAAELAYTVPQHATDDPGSSKGASPFIQSRVRIQVEGQAASAVVRARLVAPEFVLVEDARQQFLTLLRASCDAHDAKQNIILQASADYQSDYRTALLDPSLQQGALVFLSYRGQPPQPHFLVLWQGTISGDPSGEARAFAFTCEQNSNSLANFKMVLRLEDPEPTSGPLPIDRPQYPSRLTKMQYADYVGFHNFMHAVRIWDMRGGWLLPGGGN